MTAPRSAPAGYRDQVGAHPSPWEGEVPVLDLFLHDLGLGVFLAATVAAAVAPGPLAPLLRIAWPLSVALVGADMLLLLGDQGDWTRFFHMFRVMKPGTPMSLGVWTLSAFLAAAVVPAAWGVASLGGMAGPLPGTPVRWLAWAALVLAFPATVYKGAVFSITSQPGWRDARWTAGATSASAVLLGCATLAPLAALGAPEALPVVWGALLPVALIEVPLFAAWTRGLAPALAERMPADRRVAETLFQWGARGASLAVLLLSRPRPVALVAVGALALVPAYRVRRVFLSLPHRSRTAA